MNHRRSLFIALLATANILLLVCVVYRDPIEVSVIEPLERWIIPSLPIPLHNFDRQRWMDAASKHQWEWRLPMSKKLAESNWLNNRSRWEVKMLLGLPDRHYEGRYIARNNVGSENIEADESWSYFVTDPAGLEWHVLEVSFRNARVIAARVERDSKT